MPLTQILLISLALSSTACFLSRRKKIILSKPEQILISVGPIILTALSLFISVVKNGGTIKFISCGWPHFFYLHYLEDVMDKIPINKWYFVPGNLFSYPLSNYLFYLSWMFLFVVLARMFKKRNHHSAK